MKISTIIAPGLLAFCTLLFESIFGYHVLITDPSLSVIWDASLRLEGCHYQMHHKDCRDFLLGMKLDSASGLLYTLRLKTTHPQKARACTVKISISNCDGLADVVYPLHITVAPHHSLGTNFQVPMNVTFRRPMWEGEFEDTHHGLLNNIIPETLRRCEVTENLPRHGVVQGSNVTPYGGNSILHNNRGRKVTLSQSITCIASHDQEVVVPNQEIVVNVDIPSDIHDSIKSHQRSTRRLFRHRRGAGSISFTSTRQTEEIFENLPANTEVIQLTLNNPHHVPVKYTLQAKLDKRSDAAFQINANTGLVTTKRKLDRENMALHTFRVTASAGETRPASCTLFIMVKDMNDNKPKFEKAEYDFTVQEDEDLNAYIGRVAASDLDQGRNRRVIYSIEALSPPNVFSVSEDGEISLRRGLDRESKAEYRFRVVATDSGTLPQHSSTQVVITVEDVNDLAPIFNQTQYHAKISENTKTNTEIITVKAIDGDTGLNGQVWYGLRNSQDRSYFNIDSTTGKITLTSEINFADYPDGYKLRVRAQDRGRPPKSKYCMVTVNIVDVNDHTPMFSNSKYEAVVSEDRDINSKILEVKANDEDAGENARISYSFVTRTARLPFRMNSATGLITLVRPLDFEDQNVYVFTVKASDHGQPPKYSTASVEVTVRDVNDNKPKFTKSLYSKRISETADIGHVVVAVEAHDLDKESTLDYSITDGNYRNKFRITTRDNKGIITLFQRLSFNERRSYLLTVRCSDGELSGYTKVSVNVTDANTHVPEFEKSVYDIDVDENVDVGTAVVRVHATDDDDGDNAMITYHFQENSDKFVIDENTGDIKTKAALDFDDQSLVQLTVIARDRGVPPQETQAEVIIYLGDVNDNAPKFDKPTYHASVPEDIRVGWSVISIHAEDADSGKNGQVMYTFDKGDDGNGYFSIGQNSGIIRTALELDREHLSSYELTAYAEDRGTPAQRTAVRILVTVTDVDDNPPSFEKDELVFNVSEDSRVGSVVAKLVATDLDEGGQSGVTYELSSIESGGFWDLDPHTGELMPAFQLDYEKQSSYVLIVSAYSGILGSEARVIINLIDVNDNPPVLNPFQVVFNNYRTDKPYAFPIGPIGKVPAHDPDVTGVLKYRFSPGTNNSLLILNETSGELRLSSKLDNDREFEAAFMIEVSDGKYNASAECHLKVVPITDEMLINSVTVRVEQMSQEDFLSNAMQQFTHGLGQILNITTQDVYIFNVQNDTDVSPHAVVNVSFSAKRADGHYLSTQQLQEQVYLNRSVLTNYSMQNVMPFDDNICLREPCENYMRCVSALYFNSSAPFISTSTILFRPIHPVSGLRCKCPDGFAGIGCQNEVNMCHASKCKNGGKCVSVEGGYVCRCNNSYAGRNCEVDLTGGRCSSANGVCKNNANCRQLPAGGLQCDCKMSGLVPSEVSKFCELRGRSFQKGDFIMFSGITRQWRFTLQLRILRLSLTPNGGREASLRWYRCCFCNCECQNTNKTGQTVCQSHALPIRFVTREKNGLLLYNGRFNHEHDYLALEILNGQVQLNFSTGQEYTVVSPYVKGGVADGKWHTVEVQYRNKPKSEVFDGEHTGPSNIKVVTVTVDPESCDPAILDKWDSKLGNYTCTKKATQGGTKSSLDLTTPLLVGGVPTLPERYQVRSKHFIGCIRDLYIDQQLVDMSSYVANHGSQSGCKAMRKCIDSPCSHGSCESVLGAYKCNCGGDYGGKRCEKIQTVHRFPGSGCLRLQSVSRLPGPGIYPWQHVVSLRTTRSEGTVLAMAIGETGKIEMTLQNGKLEYLLKIGTRGKQISVNNVLNDGEWHEVVVNWRKIGANVIVGISVDDDVISDTQVSDLVQSLNARSQFTSVNLGGSWDGRRVEDAFNGCLRGLEFKSGSKTDMPITSSNLIKTPTSARINEGCKVRDPCDGNKCPRNSDCIPRFDTNICRCHQGYVGNMCQSICKLNPCSNEGKCTLDSKAQYGYRCQCRSDMFYGRTCEHQYQYPCPSGWWAGDDHICSPCNCAFEKNFDLDCGSHGGKCICRKNYYYKSDKNACLPCNCYPSGSNGSTCEDETGQCKCKSTVIGKKCNQCSSNFAEVQYEGCNVQYGMCPQAYMEDVLWKRAKFDTTVPARCPTGTVGHAKRDCNKENGWLLPNLSNCTSKPYYELRGDIANLDKKKQYFEEHRVRMTMDAVTRLYLASNSTEELHEGDVLLSYELIMKILSSQDTLSGFDLTASRRKDFNKYLVTSTSHALASDNVGRWSSIQNSGKYQVNSAQLMKSYENYVNALTRSMLTMWAKSIQEKSDNIQLQIESLSNDEDVSLNIGELETGVKIKLFAPDKRQRSKLPKNGTVGVMEYSTIGKFLPLSYHDSRLDMKHPVKGFINSVVVSVLSHDRVSQTQPGFNLISLTFPLLQNNGSNPQCVFWNFTTSSHTPYGGWSQRGCKTEHANETHVTCTCSHLTSFAVLSDEEVVSVLDELPVKIALYGSVAVIVICILICIGCCLFLQDVTSNHSKIHCNFGVSVLLSELFFSCGIMLTASAYACMASAIFIHFFFMSTLAWVFVEGLHLYRRLTEQRDVDRGNMRIYYLIGWGIPGIITALSVGLDAKGFGNANFCWIRTDHLLVWSFAGPLLFCIVVYLVIFVLSLAKYFTAKLTEEKSSDMRTKLKSSFLLLPFICALWGLALFAVNENEAQYYYIFAILNVTLGILLLLLHCLFNKEVQSAIRSVKERRWQKAELTITKQHLLKTSFSATPDASNGPRRINMGTSVSSASTAHTPSRKNHQNSTMFHDEALSGDSDSDDSDSSIGSLASSHSSDEEAGNKPMYLNVNNSNSWQFKNGHLPMRRPLNGGLVVHSTPKELDREEDEPPFCNGTPSGRCDTFVTSLPTVSESNMEDEEEEEYNEEPHYLAINSTRKDGKKIKEENIELLPMQETDSLPRKGILKNGKKSKPPTPIRTDSLQRKASPITTSVIDTEETALIRKADMIDKVEQVAVLRNSAVSSSHDQLL